MWAGLIAGPLILVGFALAGPAPAPGEPVEVIARHLGDHRDRILAGDFLIAAGAPFYVCFQAAARPVLGLAALAGGAMGMIPGLVATSGPFAPAAAVPAVAFWALTAWSMAVALHLRRA